MNIILLSGGSGKRLWPLSNNVRSKQFLKIFKRPDGIYESMIQRIYRMINEVDPNAEIIIATSENQVDSIIAQIDNQVDISIEPYRRDTFPAIALATAYLHDVMKMSEDESVIVCPVDSYVEEPYFQMLGRVYEQALKGESNLVLMGIEPTYPCEKYGYIIPQSQNELSLVHSFKEKPNISTAEKYIAEGALWNTGVFAYKLKYVLDIAKNIFGTSAYQKLFDNYEKLPTISFDYAVVEKEPRVQVMRFSGEWNDIGTWNAITEIMDNEVSGNAVAVQCENTHIINKLQIPLIALGAKDFAIVATPDGILVTDKSLSPKLKDYVVDNRPMYEKQIWGEYQVIDYRIQNDGQDFLTKHLILMPGKHIPYQRHVQRTKIWTFVAGKGKLILEGKVTIIGRGDIIYIKPGMKYAIKADTELHIIEVQVGNELSKEDIECLDWEWERNEL